MSLDDRFELGAPIHIGQISAAYPAIQKSDQKKVLLKVIHPQWINDQELLRRFDREARALAELDHPNVVKVFAYSTTDDLPYMSIEWMDGGTLEDRIKAGPLNQQELKRIAQEILSGLRAVHQQGLIHRDLKPDNILLSSSGTVKLADFSLAGFDKRSGLTQHGAIVGSPAYMAPELIEGHPASFQSDLYSLGVILLEALTGSNPFRSADPVTSFNLIRTAKPSNLSARPNIDAQLAVLTDSLLAQNPDQRPKTAAQALKMLTGEISAPPADQDSQLPQNESSRPIPGGLHKRWFWLIPVLLLIPIFYYSVFWPDSPAPLINQIPDLSSGELKDSSEIGELQLTVQNPIPDLKEVRLDSVPASIERQDSIPIIRNEQRPIAAPQTGKLTLNVRPWAEVVIDGEEIGSTPLGTLDLVIGRHDIIFKHSLYPDLSRQVEIKAGLSDSLAIDFKTELAQVYISAEPWGVIWVDGDSIQMLPSPDPVWITPGQHFIEVVHPEFSVWQDSISFSRGEQLRLHVNLPAGTMVAH